MGLKARVKATGDIVEIYRFVDTEQNEWIDCYLDFLEPIATDYWTRLEHQYAGMAMQGILGSDTIMEKINRINAEGDKFGLLIAELSANLAHALVGKYKKEE